jgi:hypothetical protein
LFIADAVVKLFEQDVYVETLKHDSIGFYSSQTKAVAGKEYTITVEKDNFPIATAFYSFKSIPDVNITNFEMNIIADTIFSYDYPEPGEIQLFHVKTEIDIELFDNPDEENYYALSLYTEKQDIEQVSVWNESENNYDDYFRLREFDKYQISASLKDTPENEAIFKSGFYISEHFSNNHFFVISDKYFNGYKKDLRYISYNHTTVINDIDFVFKSIPKSFILYRETLDLYYDIDGNPYTEPVNVLSNIENGLGFACGISCARETINVILV